MQRELDKLSLTIITIITDLLLRSSVLWDDIEILVFEVLG